MMCGAAQARAGPKTWPIPLEAVTSLKLHAGWERSLNLPARPGSPDLDVAVRVVDALDPGPANRRHVDLFLDVDGALPDALDDHLVPKLGT